MTETCNKCKFKEECEKNGYEMDVEDQDECEHLYGFSERELEEAE